MMNYKIKTYIDTLYQKSINNAQKSIASKLLFFFAFIEAIVFPIPVDPLLAFLVLANKKKLLHLTILCTLGSVAGGIIGWIIGYYVGPSVKYFLVNFSFMTIESFNEVIDAHKKYGSLIVFLGAFTPLPFKIISITSGFFGISLFSFILMSLIGRGLRFVLISLLVSFWGDKAIELLRKRFFFISSIIGVVIFFVIYFKIIQ